MNTSLLNVDLRLLPKNLFLLFLLAFPIFAYVVSNQMGMDPSNILGLICLSYLLFRLCQIYKTGSNLVMPLYVVLFGFFTGYVLLNDMFVSNRLEERGIKYFYSNSIWLTFIAFIIVENIHFSFGSLKFAKRILEFTLILASVVSIIQISNPLFFINDELFVQGLSVDRMAEYYRNVPHAKLGTNGEAGYVDRFLKGYRLSIFSYIDGMSVGMDTIAIFSILVAWRPINSIKRGVFTLSAAIVSFLSSARWMMLNFFVVASDFIWSGKNKLANFIYFVFSSIVVLMILCLIANFMGFDVKQFISERLLSDSAGTRILAFEVFFEVFPDNPIFGTGGADTEKMLRLVAGKSSQIHVGFLKLFYYYGLVGGLLYLSFMVAFLIRLRIMAKHSGYWGGFLAILTFFIANLTLFELSLFYYGPLLAIIFANHFYFNKMENKDTLIMNGKSDYPYLN